MIVLNLKRVFLVLILSSLISGCHSVELGFQEFWYIEKGLNKEKTIEIIKGGNEYGVKLINAENQDYIKISKDIDILITYKWFPEDTENPDTYYLFAFKNDRLIYWGLPIEFNRHTNTEINEIGEKASKILIEKYLESDD